MSDVYTAGASPIDYAQFAPPGAAPSPKPAPVAPPVDYTAERLKLAEKSKEIGDEEIAKLRQGQAQYEKLAHQRTAVPPDPKLAPPAPAPHQDFTDPIKAFQNPAVVIATLGSLFSRAPLTAAMNAAGAAMEAYHKGEAETFKLKRDEWKENFDRALEINKIELEKYQAAWRRSDAAVKDKMAEMLAVAAGQKNETMIAAIKSGQIDKIDGIYEGLQKAREKAMESRELLERQEYMARYRADIEVKKTEEKEKLKLKLEQGVVDQETGEFLARQLIAGNYNALTGLFRTKGAKIVVEKAAKDILEKEKGMSPQQAAEYVTSQANKFMGERRYQATAGGYAARVESATNEVEQLVPQAMEASRALPRGWFVPLNKLVMKYNAGISDPAYNDFVLANFGLMNAYARAMNPTGTPHVNDRLEAHAQQILSLATSPEAYETQVKRLWIEVQASKKAQALTREGLGAPKGFPGATTDKPEGSIPDKVWEGKTWHFKGGNPNTKENWEPLS